MLFEKIRRTQKPVFIGLALVFTLSFVFLGVGSGVNSLSLGNLLGGGGSSSGSVSDLLNKVHADPKDASAWLQLGDAYQADNNTASALGAYGQYLILRPKDVTTMTQVATLYETQAERLAQKAAYWQAVAGQYQSVQSALPTSAGKLGSAFSSPLVSTVQQPMQARAQSYQQQAQQGVQQAIALWKKAIVASPTDSSYERALYRDALAIQDYGTAYQAVKKVLALEPDAPDKKQLQTLEKQLQPLANLKTSSTTGSTTP
jgi:tetratricopeptide (TPR) repeat protein